MLNVLRLLVNSNAVPLTLNTLHAATAACRRVSVYRILGSVGVEMYVDCFDVHALLIQCGREPRLQADMRNKRT